LIQYDQALALLFGRINYERNQPASQNGSVFKLERMQQLLDRIGNPQAKLPAVHIAGTKGKGSTAIMIASILHEARLQVGLFTSPHVSRFEERLQVNGRMPNSIQLSELFSNIWPQVEQMDQSGVQWAPTFFEITTALAWLYFSQMRVDIVVLEVGLGGRLDATNICNPLVTIITNISYDHMNLLGREISQIAAEKAGIIKTGVPLITAAQHPDAQKVILDKAHQTGTKTLLLGRDFHYATRCICDGLSNSQTNPHPVWLVDVETYQNRWSDIIVPLTGAHQACNTAIVLQCIDLLEQMGWQGLSNAAVEGLQQVRWPLRCEHLLHQPHVIVDAAHNPASVKACLDTLAEIPVAGKRILIFAATREKEVSIMMEMLLPRFDHVIMTAYQTNPRAVAIDELVEIAQTLNCTQYEIADTPERAWQAAQSISQNGDLICVTGSFFLAAEIREIVVTERSPCLETAGQTASKREMVDS